MAMKLTNKENDKLKQQDLDYGEKTLNVENETYTLQDLEYGENH